MSTYPGADITTQWFDDDFGWDVITPNVVVVHTTEGFGWPSYRDSSGQNPGSKAPHMTINPDIANKRLRLRQHFHNEHSSRALANTAGGVSTNTNNAWQFELVGTCDDQYRSTWGTRKAGVDYIHWPTAPEWALRELAKIFRYLSDKFPVPLRSTVTFAAFNKSLTANVRLSGTAWNQYTGYLGHQHVPENSHGDPGSFPIQKVIDYAKALAVPEKTPTTSVCSCYPNPTLRGHDVVASADVNPAVPGRFQFQYSTDGGKTWSTWANAETANGKARTEARPGGDQKYRVVFTPKDTAKYASSTSPAIDVKVYDLAELIKKIEA